MIIAPDGLLTAVPWSALPGDEHGAILLERHALAVVPHAPFVLDLLTSHQRTTSDVGTLLAVGGTPSDLPGAARELETVIGLAGSRHVVRLQGDEAGTAAVVHSLPQARWVHFATHGFFADPDIPSVLQADPDPSGRLGRDRYASASLARNPLVLSGLVIGGSSGRFASPGSTKPDDKEILTAEVIAGLPLQGLDLAVLSACETGLGTVAGGEGVFGLQRAFHLAGTRTVVASLWAVHDRATQALMAEFYRNLWEKKLPRVEALRQAQLHMMKEHGLPLPEAPLSRVEKRTGPVAAGESDRLPPAYWAAFVLSGDWK